MYYHQIIITIPPPRNLHHDMLSRVAQMREEKVELISSVCILYEQNNLYQLRLR